MNQETSGVALDVLIKLRPATGWQAIDLGGLFRFRDLLMVLAVRDVKLRYRQTVIGVAWVLLQPLLAAGILSFVFGVVASVRSFGHSQFVISFAGMVGWQVFGSTLSKVSLSMVGNAQLVSKVYFPRLILPLSTLGSTLIDLCVSLGLMAVVCGAYAIVPGWTLMTLPFWILLLVAASLGLGLIAGALTVSYRDVQFALPVLIPFMMYASPVAYAVGQVPARYQHTLYLANPLVSLIEGFRWSLLGGAAPPAWAIAYSAASATIWLLIGAAVFKRMERRFADVI
jgi:lipopolysaccharide transport system permease protein